MKLLLGILAILILAFCVVAMYCAIIVAGRSDEEYNNKDNNNGEDNDMFFKKQICPKCKVGQETYRLDNKSEACPFIHCWHNNKCSAFEPLDKPSKNGIFSNIKNKRSVTPPPRKIGLYTAFYGAFGAVA